MNHFRGLPAPHHAAMALGRDDRRHRSAGLTLLALAALVALWLTALSSGASTPTAQASLPGTNGLIACSGPLGPNPPPANGSFLEIFTMNDSGSIDPVTGAPTSQVRLQNNITSDFNPRFNADATQITFIKQSETNPTGSVWKMNANGTNEVQLTNTSGSAPFPSDSFVGGWSPDGTKIVFQRSVLAAGGNPANFEVFTINSDGTGLTNLTNNPGSATVGSSDSQPTWSPDGTKIAFQSNRLGNPDIWIMNADGTGARPLTANSLAEESAPEFSPDGQQIAFQSDRGFFPRPGVGRNLEIYRMNARDGSNVVRLTFNDYNPAGAGGETTANLSGFDLNPHWSPQGDRIVFHSGRDISFGAAQWDAFSIDSTVGENPIGGMTARQLTKRDFNDERCGWGVATPHLLLSVTKAGSGTGTVTSSLPGIDCGDDCAGAYAPGTMVTLTAAPAANGSTFTGFTGGGCSGPALTCTVTVDAAKTVTATFADTNPALTVVKAGPNGKPATGSGTVTSAPAGIDCGADCTQEYAAGTMVTLTAAPAAGSTFGGFTGGGCTGTGTTCTVTVSEATTVTAIFAGPLLTVVRAGDGVGTVSSDPLGISCGTDCSEDYAAGTMVTLTATFSTSTVAGGTGSTFAGFTGGGCTGTAVTCTVTMDAAKTVTATFVDNPTLTVSKTGTGGGTVTSAPAGLSCGATCTRDFPKDSTVTLTAAATAGSAFAGFTGCATTPTATTCTVTMDAAKTVTARFIVPRTLTVTKAGAGTGTVTSSPTGIDCGSDCTEDFDNNTVVTLTAAAAAGSTFTGFTGAGCTGTATTCMVTMDAAKTVTATFSLTPRLLTVTRTGNGAGTVTSSPAGINCGADCTENYDNNTVVTLTAAPTAATSTFAGFTGGGCSGTATTCMVTMDAAKTVTATFTLISRTLTVTKAGSGSGTVTSSPAGINCGADCTESYDHGVAVNLVATPASGSTFAGFSGAGCSALGLTCTVPMDQAQTVTATFTANPVTPPPPPPPPPVAPPPPPPPPIAAPTRRAGSLSASVTPSRDTRAPFVFRTSGRLTLPSGMTRAQGCNGRVSVQVKRGTRTISTRRVNLSSTCTYSSRVSFANRSRFGRATRLKFSARFLGNALVLPDAATSRFARIRR